MSNIEIGSKPTAVNQNDELDEWDERIFSTGCAAENTKMNDCYYDTKDWRLCKEELELFKQCWKRHQNDERISTKLNYWQAAKKN